MEKIKVNIGQKITMIDSHGEIFDVIIKKKLNSCFEVQSLDCAISFTKVSYSGNAFINAAGKKLGHSCKVK